MGVRDNAISLLDWAPRDEDLIEFVVRLCRLRCEESVFRRGQFSAQRRAAPAPAGRAPDGRRWGMLVYRRRGRIALSYRAGTGRPQRSRSKVAVEQNFVFG